MYLLKMFFFSNLFNHSGMKYVDCFYDCLNCFDVRNTQSNYHTHTYNYLHSIIAIAQILAYVHARQYVCYCGVET